MTRLVTDFDPRAVKGLPHWGSQEGLLSLSEMCALREAVLDTATRPIRALEIGHYCGLSTMVIAQALAETIDPSFHTIDHHLGDKWVPVSDVFSSKALFENNRKARFDYPWLTAQFAPSQELVGKDLIENYDFIFYDGDHGAEQLRVCGLVAESSVPRTLVVDDIDFPGGRAVLAFLEGNGWVNRAPTCFRGAQDKGSVETMTLGIFTKTRVAA